MNILKEYKAIKALDKLNGIPKGCVSWLCKLTRDQINELRNLIDEERINGK